MHYQFIMANDMRAPYEYMMLMCGPVVGAMGEAAATTFSRLRP